MLKHMLRYLVQDISNSNWNNIFSLTALENLSYSFKSVKGKINGQARP